MLLRFISAHCSSNIFNSLSRIVQTHNFLSWNILNGKKTHTYFFVAISSQDLRKIWYLIGKFWSANHQLQVIKFTWAIVTVEPFITLASPNITTRTMITTCKETMTYSYEKMVRENLFFQMNYVSFNFLSLLVQFSPKNE